MYVPVDFLILAGIVLIGGFALTLLTIRRAHASLEEKLWDIASQLASDRAAFDRLATSTEVDAAADRIIHVVDRLLKASPPDYEATARVTTE